MSYLLMELLMRTIFVLFDSLNRRSLETYGAQTIKTPNFNRLMDRSVTFDNHYVGSLPCIPARRDMQTGRLNFMHRSWGPMEPFDNALTEILQKRGVYTHLITDHLQYFRDGGATYHTRFTTFDYVRGQHGDAWKARVDPNWRELQGTFHPVQFEKERRNDHYHYMMNREFIVREDDFPVQVCFDAGLEFLDRNKDADDWFVQIETFDPHEPFHAPERFKDAFPTDYEGPILDWPPYGRVTEAPEECEELNANYCATLTFCDYQLGRLMDYMDENDMWKDTTLVVTTDHGFLLGEHTWWAKNRMPCYQEVAHIPLFVHHPDFVDEAGSRRSALTQNMDLMPSFLEIHGADIPNEVRGKSLLPILRGNAPNHDVLIFGLFASAINITDGKHIFFLYPDDQDPTGLYQYTMMPTTLTDFFTLEELSQAEMVAPFDFTKSSRIMRTPASEKAQFHRLFWGDAVKFETDTVLFDIEVDPGQLHGFRDPEIERRLIEKMRQKLIDHDAPRELYERFHLDVPTSTGQTPVVVAAGD